MPVETGNVQPYHDFIDAIRDGPLVTARSIEVVGTMPAIEDGFRSFQKRQARGAW